MEKKSWLWKRKSSDRSPGETESSTSISSHSESNSDEKAEQESSKKSTNHSQSPEVTSKASTTNSEVNDSFKSLTEKLSAALVNVGAKEDLVKQHAKVAEEAVAGWEKAENEVTKLKQELEAALQQNVALEVRANHLDGALKECVKQLRLAKEEHEQKLNEIIEERTHKWDSIKKDLEIQICSLKAKLQAEKAETSPVIDPKVLVKLENLEKENSTLKFELNAQSEELEIRTIERDLSTQAAETASKQQLESIKKVAKLEAECRKLQSLTRKSPSVNDNHKAVSISSFYVDSLTDSQSVDSFKMNNLEHNENEQGCSDSWALALMAELDQFKSRKSVAKNVTSCSDINNIMDDFLEMERIASLSEGQNETPRCNSETEDNLLKNELETMSQRVSELKEQLEKLEAEKYELENALNSSKQSLALSNAELADTKRQMVDLQKEMTIVNESKEMLESQIVNMEKNARIMSTEVESIKADVSNERRFSSEMKSKCEQLEKELVEKTEEVKLQMVAKSNDELKVKQNLEVAAADRLSECQKTISSLARQLESLATLEDFLIDTANLPGFSGNSSVAKTGGELWKLHSNDTYMPKKTIIPAKQVENNGDKDESPSSTSSSASSVVSLNHFGGHSKSKNGFEKLFSRNKNGIQGESHHG
ncbi:putative filament-like plant protein [Helianthus annuus]|nr:putative filament-like plant protein [Helianthus annuus]KAJ0923326.1 putative filament-like plant protein [Helianthus annuus]